MARGSVPPVVGEEMTIDELAALVDMTVRNVRAHQARGLLPPPTIRGRVGYYGPAHRRRLEQIRAMQEEGLNLAAIAKVLNDGQLTAITTESFSSSEPAWFTAEQLVERLGIQPDEELVRRSLELGLIELDGDRIRMDAPVLLTLAEEMTAMGVPLSAQLDALARVREAARQVAGTYLDLADQHLMARVAADSGGDPDAIRSSVDRLGEAARSALIALFNRAMADALRAHFAGTVSDAPTPGRRPPA